jgi:urease accessory protein
MIAALSLVRLLQLASPALPIGAYSYSQGLEWVTAEGIIHDAATAGTWIGDVQRLVFAPGEAAVAWRLLAAAQRDDAELLARWNTWFRASRETAELAAETQQMGGSLLKLASDLDLLDAVAKAWLPSLAPITLPTAFALAARGFVVPPAPALIAYAWSWLENQTMAAIKLVPLGQVAGQRLLAALGARIPDVVSIAQCTADEDVASFAPGLALASCHHETQYTRLFRS